MSGEVLRDDHFTPVIYYAEGSSIEEVTRDANDYLSHNSGSRISGHPMRDGENWLQQIVTLKPAFVGLDPYDDIDVGLSDRNSVIGFYEQCGTMDEICHGSCLDEDQVLWHLLDHLELSGKPAQDILAFLEQGKALEKRVPFRIRPALDTVIEYLRTGRDPSVEDIADSLDLHPVEVRTFIVGQSYKEHASLEAVAAELEMEDISVKGHFIMYLRQTGYDFEKIATAFSQTEKEIEKAASFFLLENGFITYREFMPILGIGERKTKELRERFVEERKGTSMGDFVYFKINKFDRVFGKYGISMEEATQERNYGTLCRENPEFARELALFDMKSLSFEEAAQRQSLTPREMWRSNNFTLREVAEYLGCAPEKRNEGVDYSTMIGGLGTTRKVFENAILTSQKRSVVQFYKKLEAST